MKRTFQYLARPSALLPLIVGLLLGVLGTLMRQRPGGGGGTTLEEILSDAGLLKEASAANQEGDYQFFPNRRSVWVVNRTNGRMANYHFRDDELRTIDRSRVATIELQSFPRDDTVILLSDRNLNNLLWVCNVRTGDIQMWQPTRDGTLRPTGPIPTSTDLMERGASSR